MLQTPLCDLLSIDILIVQAPIAPCASSQLVAAVSNAGGLGSVGTALQSFDMVKMQAEQVRKLTISATSLEITLAKTFGSFRQ